MATIERLSALEILDSRGRPTVQATCRLAGGAVASASVPSGRSTGAAEALELRDGEADRYRGLGCREAVANVNGAIHDALCDTDFNEQAPLDDALIELDGTENKSRLGANAILAVSIAFARAVAAERGVPLYRHFADMIGAVPAMLPRLTVNLFSGGKHAGQQIPIQDVLLVPKADTIDDGLACIYAVYRAAADLIREKYGMRDLSADEGGLAPPFERGADMLADTMKAMAAAGITPGTGMAIAIDAASSHFFTGGRYDIERRSLTSTQMIELVAGWVRDFPIVSVEDALAEDDWDHWPQLRNAIREASGGGAITLGDDLLCTNPQRIRRAIGTNAADALLLKVNQIGTLTEAAEARRLAREAGWRVTISARSGETEDDWLADLAVGWGGEQIKIGSITQSERLAKYNRLLAIEAETNLPVAAWPDG